jgi:hypothetical protein
MNERQKMSRGFRAAIVTAAILAIYALTPGPIDRMRDLEILPDGAYPFFVRFYAPLKWFVGKLPKPLGNAYRSYHTLWWSPPPWLTAIHAAAGVTAATASMWWIVRRINCRPKHQQSPPPPQAS